MSLHFQKLILGIKEAKFQKLQESRIAIIGLGGVGSYALEAIVRSGVENILIMDRDIIDPTNINRQLLALTSTIGMKKVDVAERRILDINPTCKIDKYGIFLDQDNLDIIFQFKPDFVIDCIDTIQSKYLLIKACLEREVKIISSMGTANKFHPEGFKIADLKKTSVDPIARILRAKLRKEGIEKAFPVVYSEEEPISQTEILNESKIRKESMPLSSNSFVPSTAGLLLASHVINQLLEEEL